MPMDCKYIVCREGKIYFSNTYRNQLQRIENGLLYDEIGLRSFCDSSFLIENYAKPADQFPWFNDAGYCFNKEGEIYFTTDNDFKIAKKDKHGNIKLIAGTGDYSFAIQDGIPATSASIACFNPVVNSKSEVFLYDWFAKAIYKIDTSGILTLFAGGGSITVRNNTPINKPGREIGFVGGNVMAMDLNDNIVGQDSTFLYRISPDGQTRFFPLPGISQTLKTFQFDKHNNIYFSDNGIIYKIDTNNNLSYYFSAGTSSREFGLINEDSFVVSGNYSIDVSLDNLFIVGPHIPKYCIGGKNGHKANYEGWNLKNVVLENIDATRTLTDFFVDTNNHVEITNRYYSGTALETTLTYEISSDNQYVVHEGKPNLYIGADIWGNTYFAQSNNVYKTNTTGSTTLVLGGGVYYTDVSFDTAHAAGLNFGPISRGNICVSERGEIFIMPRNNVILKIDTDNKISSFAGGNDIRINQDGDSATKVGFDATKISVDKYNQVFFLSNSTGAINMVDTNGIYHVVAGLGYEKRDGVPGYRLDLAGVVDYKIDTAGNIYLLFDDNKIKMIGLDSIVHTVCGGGSVCLFSNELNAMDFKMHMLNKFDMDDSGRIYFYEKQSNGIFQLNSAYRYLIDPNLINHTRVYPNPANENVRISDYCTIAGTATVVLYDLGGRLLDTQTFETLPNGTLDVTIDLPRGMQTGVYFLKIVTPSSNSVQRLVVQH